MVPNTECPGPRHQQCQCREALRHRRQTIISKPAEKENLKDKKTPKQIKLLPQEKSAKEKTSAKTRPDKLKQPEGHPLELGLGSPTRAGTLPSPRASSCPRCVPPTGCHLVVTQLPGHPCGFPSSPPPAASPLMFVRKSQLSYSAQPTCPVPHVRPLSHIGSIFPANLFLVIPRPMGNLLAMSSPTSTATTLLGQWQRGALRETPSLH